MNNVTMGNHNGKSVNLDEMVEDNDEENTEDVTNVTTVAIARNNSSSHISNNKSHIKVTLEEGEPTGIKPPTTNTTFTQTVTSVAKNVSETIGSLQEKYAYMLGVMPCAINNLNLYQFIDDWYGVKYHLGGCNKDGIDCSAFVQKVYENVFGTNLLRTAIEQFASSDFVKKATHLKEGDLVFFRIHSRHITHVGIYLANNFFIHASRSQGVTISNLNDAYWRKYYAGAGTISKG